MKSKGEMDSAMSLDTYRDLLTRFWGYYAVLEERLQKAIAMYWPDHEYLCQRDFSNTIKLAVPMPDARMGNEGGVMLIELTGL